MIIYIYTNILYIYIYNVCNVYFTHALELYEGVGRTSFQFIRKNMHDRCGPTSRRRLRSLAGRVALRSH